MLVYFDDTEVHVQRPTKSDDSQYGYCNYSYSCEDGQITFTKKDCVKTW